MKAISFPVLVYALAHEHHEGALLRMAEESDVSQSTLWRWLRGLPRKYDSTLVRRLADYYNLPFTKVWDIIQWRALTDVSDELVDQATAPARERLAEQAFPDDAALAKGPVAAPARAALRQQRRTRRRAGA